MRHILPCTALFCLALCGCGGKGEAGGSTLLQGVTAAVGGNDHSCARPVPSGSAEQVACHKAAEAACAIGTSPDRVDFMQDESGEFLVKGYSCV